MSTSSTLPETRQVVRVHQFGGPEVLKLETLPMPTMSPTQVLVRTEYAGVNYIDTYHRGGLYPNPLPLELGRESSGTILAIGAEVDPALKLAVGDRVVLMAQGGYCTYAAVDPASMVRVPDGVDLRDATAAYLQGLTAHYLGTRSHAIQKGDVVLIHAAAGGTGALLVQVAKLRGATVIGTVGSEAKAELAKKAGADHVINYQAHDFLEEVRKLYPQGVHAVYDGVGKATYERSMKCLQRLGSLVLFGNASGPVPPINPLELSKHGSIFLSRPTLVDFVATREALETRANDVFGWIRDGKLKVTVAKELPLAEAAEAHKLLESRSLAGKILLKC